MKYKCVLLFGAPGSGKGTQGSILASIPGFYHSSTGDIFRSLDFDSEMGRLFWDYSSRGELVPDEFTIKLWKNYMQGMELTNQFRPENQILILDGIPRNVKQSKLLDETIEVVKVIYLVCTDMSKMVERLRRRALKENRIDDANDKVIQHRIEVYEQNTKPVLDCYPSDRIVRVDATMSMLKVLKAIIDVLLSLKDQIDRQRESGPPPLS